MKEFEKIEYINKVLIELASGNFDVSCDPTDDKDEFDAIIAGIDMLREELKYSTVSRSYLKSIYNGITDMLLVLDESQSIIQVNQEVLNHLGYTEREIVDKHVDFVLDSDSKESLEQLKFELENGIKGNNFELNFRCKNGNSIPTSCSGSILVSSTIKEKQTMLIAKDISAIKAVERKLIAKNKELDTFVYKSSHDLKGPLASIIGLTNIASMEIEDEAAINYFNLIKKSATRLDKILFDLSELARLRNTATKVSLVNLEEIVEDVIASFFIDSKLQDKVQIIKNFDPILNLYSNDKILTSIFQNIIGNSIKYRKVNSKTDPFILIELRQLDDGISVLVKDNGTGINKEKLPRIFDMFERANLSSDGSGLGLYIVKTSLDKIKGEISVTSEEGKGSTFTMYLPSLNEQEEISFEGIL